MPAFCPCMRFLKWHAEPDASSPCMIGEVRRVKRGWQGRGRAELDCRGFLYATNRLHLMICATLHMSHGRIWTQLCSHARILLSHPLDLSSKERTAQLKNRQAADVQRKLTSCE